MKIQERVLESVYLSNKPIKIKEIAKEIDLKKKQVYRALIALQSRHVVKLERDKEFKIGYKKIRPEISASTPSYAINKIERILQKRGTKNGK